MNMRYFIYYYFYHFYLYSSSSGYSKATVYLHVLALFPFVWHTPLQQFPSQVSPLAVHSPGPGPPVGGSATGEETGLEVSKEQVLNLPDQRQ